MKSTPPQAATFADCPFCGFTYYGRPNQCSRCGSLLNEAAEDAKRASRDGRQNVRTQKALSDTFFLVGLLLGGPMMAIGGNLRIGLFIVFGGGLSSIIRRYSDWSNPGTVIVGAAFAAILAAWFVEPPTEVESAEAEAARVAYVGALASSDADLFAETRGVGDFVVWFTLARDEAGECGDYPPALEREHLAELGFLRVVVAVPNQSGGLCSFKP